MTPSTDDTIAAIASAPGGAPRGVIRMSGPDALDCLRSCFIADDNSPEASSAPTEPHVLGGQLQLPPPFSSVPCDAFVWPTNRSYTRQPSVEIHTLGSPPLLEAALEAVCTAGARLAGPGEFTLRAFLAGRLDLTQVEAVLGVIDADDRRELDVALEQLSGGLAGPLHRLRDQLLDLLAHLEAGLDFVEEDIEFISADQSRRQLAAACESVDQLERQMANREKTSAEPRVVLYGWPNVGKSSLLNALAREPAALVSGSAGTTRDFVGCRIDLDGTFCLVIDTAGVEPSPSNALSEHAQAMADRQREHAHLQLFCLDATRGPNDWERAELERPAEGQRLVVWTKSDRAVNQEIVDKAISTSSLTGDGLVALRDRMRCLISQSSAVEHHFVAATSVRCRDSLRAARDALRRAGEVLAADIGEELVAAEVRVSLDELGRIVGAVYTDDVLDRIFSRFCIGK